MLAAWEYISANFKVIQNTILNHFEDYEEF